MIRSVGRSVGRWVGLENSTMEITNCGTDKHIRIRRRGRRRGREHVGRAARRADFLPFSREGPAPPFSVSPCGGEKRRCANDCYLPRSESAAGLWYTGSMVSSYTPATAAPPSLPRHAVPSNVPIPRLSPPSAESRSSLPFPAPAQRTTPSIRLPAPPPTSSSLPCPLPSLDTPLDTGRSVGRSTTDRPIRGERLPRGAPGTYPSCPFPSVENPFETDRNSLDPLRAFIGDTRGMRGEASELGKRSPAERC